MTRDPNTDLAFLRQTLSEYKADLAKIIVGMQTGGDRKRRRELTRRMDASKRRAKSLSRQVDEVLATLDAEHEARPELETAAIFLGKVLDLGNGT